MLLLGSGDTVGVILRRDVARYDQIGQSNIAAVGGLYVENVTLR